MTISQDKGHNPSKAMSCVQSVSKCSFSYCKITLFNPSRSKPPIHFHNLGQILWFIPSSLPYHQSHCQLYHQTTPHLGHSGTFILPFRLETTVPHSDKPLPWTILMWLMQVQSRFHVWNHSKPTQTDQNRPFSPTLSSFPKHNLPPSNPKIDLHLGIFLLSWHTIEIIRQYFNVCWNASIMTPISNLCAEHFYLSWGSKAVENAHSTKSLYFPLTFLYLIKSPHVP